MYKSPITIIESTIDSFAKSIIKQKDDAIFAEIQHSFGVDMDKEELIRALQYDRNQYEKGYADGKADATQKWIPVTERLPDKYGEYIVAVREETNEMYTDYADYAPDQQKWKTGLFLGVRDKVTHWMPLPEPPNEE